MASLFIKNPMIAGRVERLAKQHGTSKTALIDRALDALERIEPAAFADPDMPPDDPLEWMKWHRARNPLPPKVREAGKAFFDRMWGEPD
ncbi:hypothetical protein [Sphingomonas sp.]|uniref:hypothetical protein n=1 Tax=Sphingomonas sp. TaxID=28214 RepID=UPI003AFF6752